MSGSLALVGGEPFTPGCTFDRALVEEAGGAEALVLPTGAAYEHPDRLVAAATAHLEAQGGTARGLPVLSRPDAMSHEHAGAVRGARFLYLAGSSPMHLRSVLKDTPVWAALGAAWRDGAVLAASDAGAMVVCDPMVDPRGGAFTLGLGLLAGLTVVPAVETWSEDALHRTRDLSPPGLVVLGIPRATAVVRSPDGTWRAEGAGDPVLFRNGGPVTLADLPSPPPQVSPARR